MDKKQTLHIVSPLYESTALSQACSARVFLKMDAFQPSGSFKIRGISYHCALAMERGANKFVSSSGGNAGMAVAYTARQYGVPCIVVVPESTPEYMREKIRKEGAEVIVFGEMWATAHLKAIEIATDPSCALIHPFDHPEIWEGHMSIIRECEEQMPSPPSSIITVVGGGGLLVGIIKGLHAVGWDKVPIYACESKGADSFAQAVEKNELVTLPGITSIAKTLGAVRVCEELFNLRNSHPIIPVVVEDRDAVHAVYCFQRDHQVLVEAACGVGLAVLYGKKKTEELGKNILVIVCGGNMMDIDILQALRTQFNV